MRANLRSLFAPLLLAAGVLLVGGYGSAGAEDAPDPADWPAVEAAARGQTVYWHAWGGEPRINDYIAWVGEQAQARYGVTLTHVKLTDTAEAVARVVAEKAAGKDSGGAVDLLWVNGENFAALKRQGLLFGPWAEQLPNWRFVDVAGKPTVRSDFTVPTEGMEAPWGMAQLVFFTDSARLETPPTSVAALLAWARKNPGRFTFPQLPAYLGSTVLKQALYGLIPDPTVLQAPAGSAEQVAEVTAPLWDWLDALTPLLWRQGKAYPQNGAALRRLVNDGEVLIGLAFDPSGPSAAIANFELPPTTRSFVFDGGTIGNTHFVAIPYNASAKAGAMVVANLLLSPEAQARKQDPAVWGSFTVLDVAGLPPDDKARFDALDLGPATLTPAELGATLPEPHPSWMERIEEIWQQRYGVAR